MLSEEELAKLPFDPRKTADPNLTLPDLTDALIGWRAWECKLELPKFGVSPRLESVSHGYYWTPGRAAMAECGKHKGEECPQPTCSCGFYSAKSVRHLLKLGYHRYDVGSGMVTVIGKCALWHTVIEGSQGWRSTYAYPTQLYVPFEAAHLAKPIQEGYGCKVALMNFLNKRG